MPNNELKKLTNTPGTDLTRSEEDIDNPLFKIQNLVIPKRRRVKRKWAGLPKSVHIYRILTLGKPVRQKQKQKQEPKLKIPKAEV